MFEKGNVLTILRQAGAWRSHWERQAPTWPLDWRFCANIGGLARPWLGYWLSMGKDSILKALYMALAILLVIPQRVQFIFLVQKPLNRCHCHG